MVEDRHNRGAIIVTGVYAGFLLANLIRQTLYRDQTWLDDFESQHYISSLKLSMPLAAWTLVPDVYILVLPITGVLRLQLPPRRKVAVSMVFMTGIGYVPHRIYAKSSLRLQ